MKKVILILVVLGLLQSCYKPLQEKVINSNTCDESRKYFRIEVTKIYEEYPNTTPQNVLIRTELVSKVKENYETKNPTCEFSLDFMDNKISCNLEEYQKQIKLLNDNKIIERKYLFDNCWVICKCDDVLLNEKLKDIENKYNNQVDFLRNKYNCYK